MSSKTLTISLQNLNTLYFKFLNQYLYQYLPKNIQSDLSTLLNLKSPLDVYRYLNTLLNGNNNNNLNNNNFDSSSNEDRQNRQIKKQKDKNDIAFNKQQFTNINKNKNHQNNNQTLTEKSNQSYQGSVSYISKDDFKYLSQQVSGNSPLKKPLKLTNTYKAEDQQTNQKLLQDLKGCKNSTNYYAKGEKNGVNGGSNNNYSNPLINVGGLNSGTHTSNMVKHDFDTFSQKRASGNHNYYLNNGNSNHYNSNVLPFTKKQSKDSSSGGVGYGNNIINNTNIGGQSNRKQEYQNSQKNVSSQQQQQGYSNKYNFLPKQKSKQKISQFNSNSSQVYGKIQFSKTYSIRQPDKVNHNNSNFLNSSRNLNINNNHQLRNSKQKYSSSISPPSLNRNKLINLIKQTKQLLKQNSIKIQRYQKLSSLTTTNSPSSSYVAINKINY